MHRKDPDPVNNAFSKQAAHYDHDDYGNIVLRDLRHQIYKHVDSFLSPASRILELNAGTGIDAVRFVKAGHFVHATDLSDGMIEQLERKKRLPGMERLTVQQVSYHDIDQVNGRSFDLVFSNFGGLNCTEDLENIGEKLPALLQPGGYVTWVVMPVLSAWEIASAVRESQCIQTLEQQGNNCKAGRGRVSHLVSSVVNFAAIIETFRADQGRGGCSSISAALQGYIS